MSEFYDQEKDLGQPVHSMDTCPDCQGKFLQYNQDDERLDTLCAELDNEEWLAFVKCGDCGYSDEMIFHDQEIYRFDAVSTNNRHMIEDEADMLSRVSSARFAELLQAEGVLPRLNP